MLRWCHMEGSNAPSDAEPAARHWGIVAGGGCPWVGLGTGVSILQHMYGSMVPGSCRSRVVPVSSRTRTALASYILIEMVFLPILVIWPIESVPVITAQSFDLHGYSLLVKARCHASRQEFTMSVSMRRSALQRAWRGSAAHIWDSLWSSSSYLPLVDLVKYGQTCLTWVNPNSAASLAASSCFVRSSCVAARFVARCHHCCRWYDCWGIAGEKRIGKSIIS
jgi:hypothetical protein